MLPDQSIYTDLLTFATTTAALILNPNTPQALRRLLVDLAKDIRRELPEGVLVEIQAAEAAAAIKASIHLRRAIPDN